MAIIESLLYKKIIVNEIAFQDTSDFEAYIQNYEYHVVDSQKTFLGNYKKPLGIILTNTKAR